MVDTLDKAGTQCGMSINFTKTKTMRIGEVIDDDQPATCLKLNILAFSYLGSEVGQTARVDGENLTGEGSHGLPDLEEKGLQK